MKFYKKFLTFSRAKQIALGVCFAHFFVLFSLLVHHVATSRFKTPRPLVVRNVQLKAEVKVAAPTKPKPVAKVTEKPKPVAKKAVEKPKAIQKEAVKEIAKSLESPKRPPLTIPAKIAQKKQEVVETKEEPTYGEFLIAYLQSALDLPEFGEVKAKIEIDRFGHLIGCEIVEAKSFKNALFLKNQLPDLSFPSLNEFGIVEATYTFTITFRNVEIR